MREGEDEERAPGSAVVGPRNRAEGFLKAGEPLAVPPPPSPTFGTLPDRLCPTPEA